ncbi:hypothetical protein BDV19DRAFT_373882 [Aspergillus venezuelensis]
MYQSFKINAVSNPQATAIMQSIQQPPGDSLTHLRSDGVLRCFDGDRNVIDYRALSLDDKDLVLQLFPRQCAEQFKAKYPGVDGRLVSEDEMTNPGGRVLPKAN